MSNEIAPIRLQVQAQPELARLVRMTAANVAMLSSMTVDRVEDLRMAAEEAFIYACGANPEGMIDITFTVDKTHVEIEYNMGQIAADDESSVYADLILTSVCDSYEKDYSSARLVLDLKADV